MNGIFWASLGAVIGILAPLLYRLWQRGVASSADSLPRAAPLRAAPRPGPGVGHATRQPAAPAAASGLNRRQARKFHGVSVKPCLYACKAAQELAGQRFLPDEAPAIPLPGCDEAKCRCAYSHHGDRRDRENRRSGWGTFGGFAPSIPGGNRRAKSRDRRS